MRTINGIELDNFTVHYLIAALWSTTDNSTEQGGEPLDSNYSLDDIAPETLRQAKEDCEAFQRDNAADLALVPHTGREWSTDEQNGHDFWLTRNGHGAGFWDRGYGELGKRLTDAAHVWGSVDLYVGDDGKIYA
jgi:hypothetical protein